MNAEALVHFRTAYWPHLSDLAEFHVFGSSPSAQTIALCAEQGWQLHANLTNAQLDQELDRCEFAILPFARSAGSKLKFYDALGRGMYVLSTASASAGMANLPRTVVVGDDPQIWRSALAGLDKLTPAIAEESWAYAKRFTWAEVYGRFLDLDDGPLGNLWRLSAANTQAPATAAESRQGEAGS